MSAKTHIAHLLALVLGATAACGGSTPVSGFQVPDTVTRVYDLDNGDDEPADWSCLGTPSDRTPTAVEVVVTGTVFEFLTPEPVPEMEVIAFAGADVDDPIDTAVSDAEGAYSLTFPVGTGRFGLSVSGEGMLPTLRLSQHLEPDEAEQDLDLDTVTLTSAAELAVLVGVTRDPGRGLAVGGVRDCQEREVFGAIATVSSASGVAEHVPRVSTFYFDETGLYPVEPRVQPYTNVLGGFLVLDLPAAEGEYFVQAWGVVSESDLETGTLTLLGEIPTPLLLDTAIMSGIEPLRTE
jgi:hypothetical protein